MTVAFNVIGLPAPQGSKTRMPNGFMVEAGREKLAPWRTAVANEAQKAQEEHGTIEGPVIFDVRFYFPLPKSDPHRYRHTSKPDLDKLLRSTFDAVVHARLLKDDSQICTVAASKFYATGIQQFIGARIFITATAHEEAEWREISKARLAEERKAERAARGAS